MIVSPCKGCSNRGVGCHSECQPYLDWVKEYKRINDIIRKENSFYAYKAESRRRYLSNKLK